MSAAIIERLRGLEAKATKGSGYSPADEVLWLAVRKSLPALLDCAEALERLRVAQRAYMADRGNDALGKKVGEAAIVADAALAALERAGK